MRENHPPAVSRTHPDRGSNPLVLGVRDNAPTTGPPGQGSASFLSWASRLQVPQVKAGVIWPLPAF